MKNKTAIVAVFAGIALLAGAAWGQNQPKPKSQKELDGLRAIDTAPSAEARLQKIDDFLSAFADSDFKLMVLDEAVEIASEKNDYPLALAWGQRDLSVNPKSYVAMASLALVTANNTKEFDLDKDQKVKQATTWATEALDALKTAPRPFQFPEDKWPMIKTSFEASCHQALGLIGTVNKKYDVAATEFQTAYDLQPEPSYLVRKGEAQSKDRKYDDAIATYDKVLAMPDLNPVVKRVTENMKNNALRAKNASVAPAAKPAAAPAPPPAAPAPAPPAQDEKK
ncbi:MAG TPA: hypothetical protein VMJ34_17450 [Bryobacteraceae bacterium]|nr:hypothetical protein [Bryobacteraceae bacterium]